MDSIVRSVAQFIVWALILIGGLCLLLSPVARYATGDEMYLWIALGTSFIALMLALGVCRLARQHE